MKKILLDENLPIKLKHYLPEYEVYTVRDLEWNSLKNGILLAKAIEQSFQVFITTDKNLPYQQNTSKIQIAIVVLDIVLLKWAYIEPLLPALLEMLPTVQSCQVYKVNNSEED